MQVFTSPIISLDYDSVKKVLYQNWDGFATSVQFREAIDKTVDFVKQNPVLYIVSNTTTQRPVGPEDGKYAASKMPVLFSSGVKAMAFVLPKNVLTKLALSNFAKEQGMPSNVRYFDDLLYYLCSNQINGLCFSNHNNSRILGLLHLGWFS
jgi:hypothetical protein